MGVIKSGVIVSGNACRYRGLVCFLLKVVGFTALNMEIGTMMTRH